VYVCIYMCVGGWGGWGGGGGRGTLSFEQMFGWYHHGLNRREKNQVFNFTGRTKYNLLQGDTPHH